MNVCGYFALPDLFDDDEPGESCDNEATHTSCNYGNVCEEHKCRCSKPLVTELDKNTLEIINGEAI